MNDVARNILGSVGATVLAALIFWAVRNRKAAVVWVRGVGSIVDDVALIKAEVLTNGGKSLKDKVVAIGDAMSVMEARQRGLISTLARATFETDANFNWTEGNMAVERLTGYGFAHLARRQWKSFVHEDDRPAVMDEIAHAVKDKRAATISFRFVNPQNEEVPVRLEAKPTFSHMNGSEDGPAVIRWFGWLERTGPMDADQRVHQDRRTDARRLSS